LICTPTRIFWLPKSGTTGAATRARAVGCGAAVLLDAGAAPDDDVDGSAELGAGSVDEGVARVDEDGGSDLGAVDVGASELDGASVDAGGVESGALLESVADGAGSACAGAAASAAASPVSPATPRAPTRGLTRERSCRLR